MRVKDKMGIWIGVYLGGHIYTPLTGQDVGLEIGVQD
jgi:hypothetical protein